MRGEFIWVDLSTFSLEEAQEFYRVLFQWDYSDDGSGYLTGSRSEASCAGLYEMPEFFQKIRMPSFWMTYFSVSDLDSVVAKAGELGGKVELEETNALGKVALIRDPAGAGFTCYEGIAKSALAGSPQQGRWCRSELFVSDFSKVQSFYRGLFGWSFEEDEQTADRYWIRSERGERIGAVQVAGNEVKGEKEFWGVFFGVSDLEKKLKVIEAAGGEVVSQHENSSGVHSLVYDSQGAAFFVTREDRREKVPAKEARKWRSLLGLLVVYLAIYFEADWLWAVLFFVWVIPDLKSGTTYFIEPLSRRGNPILYWAVVLTWLSLSAYLLF